MAQVFSNFSQSTLAVALSAALTDTTATVTPTQGGKFTDLDGTGDYQMLVLTDGADYEVVKFTDRNADDLTIERAQEGTAPKAWSSGVTTIHAVTTKETLDNFIQRFEVNPAKSIVNYSLFR